MRVVLGFTHLLKACDGFTEEFGDQRFRWQGLKGLMKFRYLPDLRLGIGADGLAASGEFGGAIVMRQGGAGMLRAKQDGYLQGRFMG